MFRRDDSRNELLLVFESTFQHYFVKSTGVFNTVVHTSAPLFVSNEICVKQASLFICHSNVSASIMKVKQVRLSNK